MLGAAAVCGIDNVRRIAEFECLRSLIDMTVEQFITERRGRDADGGTVCHRIGVLHRLDVEILRAAARLRLARPDEVEFAAVAENRAVDRPKVARRCQFARQRITAGRVFRVVGAQDKHAVVFVVAVIGGEVDIPARVGSTDLRGGEIVQFGRPVFLLAVGAVGHGRVPDRHTVIVCVGKQNLAAFCNAEARDRCAVHRGIADNDVIVFSVLLRHKGVCQPRLHAGEFDGRLGACDGAEICGDGDGAVNAGAHRRFHGRTAPQDKRAEQPAIVEAHIFAEAAARDGQRHTPAVRDDILQRERAVRRYPLGKTAARDARDELSRVRPCRFCTGRQIVQRTEQEDRIGKSAARNLCDHSACRVFVAGQRDRAALESAARDADEAIPGERAERMRGGRAAVAAVQRLPGAACHRQGIGGAAVRFGGGAGQIPAADQAGKEKIAACTLIDAVHARADGEVVMPPGEDRTAFVDMQIDVLKGSRARCGKVAFDQESRTAFAVVRAPVDRGVGDTPRGRCRCKAACRYGDTAGNDQRAAAGCAQLFIGFCEGLQRCRGSGAAVGVNAARVVHKHRSRPHGLHCRAKNERGKQGHTEKQQLLTHGKTSRDSVFIHSV